MKLTCAILAIPVVALAAPNFMDPVMAPRDGVTDVIQLLSSGITKAVACFDVALDKAGVRKPGAEVPQPPVGVDCDALIALVNGGSPSGTASSASSTESTSTMGSSASSASTTSSPSASTSSSPSSETTSSTSTTESSSSTSSMSTTSTTTTTSTSSTESSSAASATSSG